MAFVFITVAFLVMMFVFPASVEVDPLTMPLLPTSGNPDCVRTRWPSPVTMDPDVIVAPWSPPVVSINPNPTSVWRSYSDYLSRGWWWANPNTKAYV